MDKEELEIEKGALIPTYYKKGQGAERTNELTCVEVGEEYNVYADGSGQIRRENQRAKTAFEDYINLGPSRTLERLARFYQDESNLDWTNNFDSILRQLKGYSSNFDWQNRLRMLLTQEAASAISDARIEQTRSARGRIALAKKLQQVGNQLMEKAAIYLNDNLEEIGPKNVNTVLRTAVTMLDTGLAAERIEIGEAMETILPPKPISTMPDDELAEFIAHLSGQMSKG